MKVLSYIIVGSGYRAEFYARIAAAYPQLFRAIFLCRSEEKAETPAGASFEKLCRL